MKILLIDLDGNNGGAEKILKQIYDIYNDNGHTCEVLSVENSFFEKSIETINISNLNWNFITTKYDSIIYNNKKSLKLLIFFRLLFPRSKHIYYAHGYLTKSQTILFMMINKLLSVSVFVSQSLLDSYPGTNKLLIYNSIQYENSSGLTDKSLNGKNVFMWAQLRSWKGHRILIEAFEKLWSKGMNVRLNLVYSTASSESDGLLNYVREKAKQHGCDKIQIHENMDNYLDFIKVNADMAVSSSIRPDPFPTIILEAFSLGIPIIATNMGGCEEMLDYDDRFLAQPNSTSLSSKIEYMLKLDQYHREEIVNHNLSRMTNEYGFQQFRTNVLNIV